MLSVRNNIPSILSSLRIHLNELGDHLAKIRCKSRMQTFSGWLPDPKQSLATTGPQQRLEGVARP